MVKSLAVLAVIAFSTHAFANQEEAKALKASGELPAIEALIGKDLKLARRDLCELLKSRQSARPEPGAAYVVAQQPISARVAANKLASR